MGIGELQSSSPLLLLGGHFPGCDQYLVQDSKGTLSRYGEPSLSVASPFLVLHTVSCSVLVSLDSQRSPHVREAGSPLPPLQLVNFPGGMLGGILAHFLCLPSLRIVILCSLRSTVWKPVLIYFVLCCCCSFQAGTWNQFLLGHFGWEAEFKCVYFGCTFFLFSTSEINLIHVLCYTNWESSIHLLANGKYSKWSHSTL